MKQLSFILAACILLSACHFTTGSGHIISQQRTPGNFSGISVSNGIDVEVTIGAVTEVRVSADDNVIDKIETTVSGGILKIRTKNLHNTSNLHLKVYVTVPDLTEVEASGGATVKAKSVLKSASAISLQASGGASIDADVDAPEIRAEADGGATMMLTGRTREYTVDASGGGDLNSKDLLSETTKAEASGGASLSVHASKRLIADASSGGSINYYGGATVEKNTSSGGSVEKRD